MQFEVNRGGNDNRSLFVVVSRDDGIVGNDAVRLTNYVDGVGTTYNLYGAHNAYSATEIDNKLKKVLPSEAYSDSTNGFASLDDFVTYTNASGTVGGRLY